MPDIYCSCGYVLRIQYEMIQKDWQTTIPQMQTWHIPVEICPHCGAPIGPHLVHQKG